MMGISAGSVRHELPDAGMMVQDVLSWWPETAWIFNELGMACVGCVMAPFETVAEAAQSYGMVPEALVDALRSACGRETQVGHRK